MKKIEFTKKEILRYITENELELSEFAQGTKKPCDRIVHRIAKKDERPYYDDLGQVKFRIKAGEKYIPASAGRWFCSDSENIDFKVDVPARYWMQNKTGKFEDTIFIFPLDGLTEREYKEKFKIDLAHVKNIYPEIPESQWVFLENKKPIRFNQSLEQYNYYIPSSEIDDHPAKQRSKSQREFKGLSHTKKNIEELLKRGVRRIIRNNLGTGHLFGLRDSAEAIQFNEKLVDLGIPELVFNREALTSIEKAENDKIYIKLFNAAYHDNFAEFQNYAADRIDVIRGEKSRDEVKKVQTVQEPRQEIAVRNVWGMERPMQKDVKAEPTKKYGLRKKGYVAKPYNVGVRNVFTILGEKVGDTYNWTVTMTVSVYKKLEDDTYLKNKNGEVVQLSKSEGEFDPEYGTKIEAKKSADITAYNEDEPITELNPQILDALDSALKDFKNKVENLDQNLILDLANFGEFDISNANFDDDMLEEMVNNVIKNLRRL